MYCSKKRPKKVIFPSDVTDRRRDPAYRASRVVTVSYQTITGERRIISAPSGCLAVWAAVFGGR